MHRKTGLSPLSQIIITDSPRVVLSLRFHFFLFGAVQFLIVLILTLLCVLLFNLVNFTELSPFGKELLTRLIIYYFVVC